MSGIVTQRINVNVEMITITMAVMLHQYDSGGRLLVFDLEDSEGKLTLPSGCSAYIEGTKKDGAAYSYKCSISGSEVSIAVPLQMTLISGEHMAQLKIVSGDGEVMYAPNFKMVVQRSTLQMDAEMSQTEVEGVTKMVSAQLEAARNEVQKAAAQATRAEDQADRAKDISDELQSAITAANTATANAEEQTAAAQAAASAAQEAAANAAEKAEAVDEAIAAMQSKTGDIIIHNYTTGKNYAASIGVRDGRPVCIYDEYQEPEENQEV